MERIAASESAAGAAADDNEGPPDHRRIGRKLGLFHQQEEGPGMVFWHPRGLALWRVIEEYVRSRMHGAGFGEVRTPQLLAQALWEKSGHWEKFSDGMFVVRDGERRHALKPMSCPGHIQIFRSELRSFRDLPLRFAEFGACHRNEPSGALHGLLRTRAFVQDDAHVFCREADVVGEVARFCALLGDVYRDFGFDDVSVALSLRPEQRAGSDDVWDRAEAALDHAARAAGLDFSVQPGEGAFYGPKLEWVLRDRLGREWQCGTIQYDAVLPERLDASYVDEADHRVRPVILHHAVLGSIERFVGMLLEHHAGRLPYWLAPEQALVASVAERHASHARRVAEVLTDAGVRVRLDDRDERLGRKIRRARDAAIPVIGVVGDLEVAADAVSLRRSGEPAARVRLREAAAFLSRCGDPAIAPERARPGGPRRGSTRRPCRGSTTETGGPP